MEALLARCFEEMGEEARSRRCHAVALRLSLTAGSSVESISATRRNQNSVLSRFRLVRYIIARLYAAF